MRRTEGSEEGESNGGEEYSTRRGLTKWDAKARSEAGRHGRMDDGGMAKQQE